MNIAQEGPFREIRQGNKRYSDKKKNKLSYFICRWHNLYIKNPQKIHKNVQKRQIPRDRKRMCSPKGENWVVSAGWHGVSLGTDENVLELDIGRWYSGKESACQCWDAEDVGLIPGSGRSPGGGHGNPLQDSLWKILGTEEPGGPQFIASQRVRHDWAHTCAHAHTHTHTFSGLQCMAWGKH